MLSLLIIESDAEKCKNIVNAISSSNLSVKLYSISYSGAEAINTIKNSDVDIILLDSNLSDMPGTSVLDYISKNNLTKYYDSIMVFTNDLCLYNDLRTDKYVNSIISNANNSKLILYYLNKMIQKK